MQSWLSQYILEARAYFFLISSFINSSFSFFFHISSFRLVRARSHPRFSLSLAHSYANNVPHFVHARTRTQKRARAARWSHVARQKTSFTLNIHDEWLLYAKISAAWFADLHPPILPSNYDPEQPRIQTQVRPDSSPFWTTVHSYCIT